MPLEGADEGVGSFLGSICSQDPLGNLDASDKTMKAKRVTSNNLCFIEQLDMMNDYEWSITEKCAEPPLAVSEIALDRLWQQTCWGMYEGCQLGCLRKGATVADNGVYNNSKLLEACICRDISIIIEV